MRAFEPLLDPVPLNQFSPGVDRHVGQRNIAVQQAASPAEIDLGLDLGYVPEPGETELNVESVDPASMEWLQLLVGRRDTGLKQTEARVIAGFMPPTPANGRLSTLADIPFECREPLLRRRERFYRGCDPLRVAFHAGAADVGRRQVQVLRVRQRMGMAVLGGYTVVLAGSDLV